MGNEKCENKTGTSNVRGSGRVLQDIFLVKQASEWQSVYTSLPVVNYFIRVSFCPGDIYTRIYAFSVPRSQEPSLRVAVMIKISP